MKYSFTEAFLCTMNAREEKADVFMLADENGVRKWVSFTENGGYLIGDRKNGAFLRQN